MKSTLQRFSHSVGVVVLAGSVVFAAGYAVATVYAPLDGDQSVSIVAGADPTGAIGISKGTAGERPVYYRPASSKALWIGASNALPVGCKPTQFTDDDGTNIPVQVKLDCNGQSWQAKLSRTGEKFSVKRLP